MMYHELLLTQYYHQQPFLRRILQRNPLQTDVAETEFTQSFPQGYEVCVRTEFQEQKDLETL